MYRRRGITLISLVITIVVLLILVSTAIYVGIDSYTYSKVLAFITNMQVIQDEVDLIFNEKQDITQYGISISETNKENEINEVLQTAYNKGEITSTDTTNMRYFTSQDLIDDLQMRNIDDEIIINFATREVISLNGTEYENEIYYTQYIIPGGQALKYKTENNTILSEEVVNISKQMEGLNAKIIITTTIANLSIKYKFKDSNEWKIGINYTEPNKENIFQIQEPGTYIIKVEDNSDTTRYFEKEINILLANNPMIEEEMILYNESEYDYAAKSSNWAYATKSGAYYIWVPKFAYKEENGETEIVFLRGSTNIDIWGNLISTNEYTIPNVFDKKTGIWVEQTISDNLNLINLIN